MPVYSQAERFFLARILRSEAVQAEAFRQLIAPQRHLLRGKAQVGSLRDLGFVCDPSTSYPGHTRTLDGSSRE